METIYYGGSIITMDPNTIGDAVLVSNGLIKEIGLKEHLIQSNPDACHYDFKGFTMLPGFIDTHSHFTQVAMGFMQVSLEGLIEVSDMRTHVDLFIKRTSISHDSWIQAKDYDHTIRNNQQHLTLKELDEIAPYNPMVISHKAGHYGLFNSLALKKLHIDFDTPNPEGGLIERKDGKLTGYLEENAYFNYVKKICIPDIHDFTNAYTMAQNYYASFGITTIQEGMFVEQMIPLYDMLMNTDFLKLDLVAYTELSCYEKMKNRYPKSVNSYNKHIRIGGIKIILDGSPQARTAWMEKSYQGETSYCGYPTMKDSMVIDAMRSASKKECQLLAHCNGDAAVTQFLDCLEKVEREYPNIKKLRPVIIHGQFLRRDQLQKMNTLKAIVSFFLAHVYHWGDIHIQNFGIKRASHISAAHSALMENVPFTFHQDSPVIPPDMLETLWCAKNRKTKNGLILGKAESIDVQEALKAITINAAYQYGEENFKGSISKGKVADFVILDKNPLTVCSKEIKNIQVITTIKAGEVVYKNDKKC